MRRRSFSTSRTAVGTARTADWRESVKVVWAERKNVWREASKEDACVEGLSEARFMSIQVIGSNDVDSKIASPTKRVGTSV